MHSLQPAPLCWFINTSRAPDSFWLGFIRHCLLHRVFLACSVVVTTTYTPGSFPTVGDPEWLTKPEFDLELCRKQNNHTARSQSAKREGKDFLFLQENPLEFWQPSFSWLKIFLVCSFLTLCFHWPSSWALRVVKTQKGNSAPPSNPISAWPLSSFFFVFRFLFELCWF